MIVDSVKDHLAPKRFGTVAYVCVIVHFLCGLVFTAVTAALRDSENGKFSCSVDAKSTATFKKQVDQACFTKYDQVYNSPIPLYGFVLLSIGLSVLVSVIYSLLVWKRVDEIESRHQRQTDGEADYRVHGPGKTIFYVFYRYFYHLVVRSLFGFIFTVVQHTYFYPNGFDLKFNCNLPPAEVTSNINTPKRNVSRNLNSTTVNCENATASEKWLWGIIVSVINIIVSIIIFAEVIYLLPRLPVFKRRSGVGWNDDSEFVIEYLLGKENIVPDESVPLASIENHSPHCSTQDYNNGSDSVAEIYSTFNDSNQAHSNENTPNSIVQECTTIDNDIQDIRNEDTTDSVAQECTTIENDIQDSRNEDTTDSVAQECTTIDNDIQDSRNEDTTDSVAQECTTIENDIQDSRNEDTTDFVAQECNTIDNDIQDTRNEDTTNSVAQECNTIDNDIQDTRNEDTTDSVAQECNTNENDIQDTRNENTTYSVARECTNIDNYIQDTRNEDTTDSVAQECTTIDNDIHDTRNEDTTDSVAREWTTIDHDIQDTRNEDTIDSVARECTIIDHDIQDTRNEDTPNFFAQQFTTIDNDIQDTRNEDNPAQECTTSDNDMQNSGSENCINFYKKHVLSRSLDPSIIYGPNANIDDLYVDVVIHTGRAQYNFPEKMKERHEIYDVYMKVPPHSICLERIDDLFYPNTDTEGEFPRSILVVGRPGIGKTVLTEKIIRDWAKGIDEYYFDKIVFFFKFRWFNESSNKLTDFDLKTFLRLGTGLSEEEFESIYAEIAKNPQKAILIFDGLDEYHGDTISCLDKSRSIPNDPKSGMSAMDLFIKLVLGDLFKGATVVVTSRPTAVDFYSRLNFKRNVEIIGFTPKNIKEYVMRFCGNNNTSDLATKIWKHIEGSSELLNLCYIPVNCFIVCVTLSGCLSKPRSETGALPATLTELYQRALDYLEKYHGRNANRNLGKHELDELQRIAYFGMEDRQLVFDQALFDGEMKTSGLLNSLSNPIFPLQTQFCFVHLTIQEFLAARHVTETYSPPEIKTFISDYVESSKWHLVLQFTAGLLGKKMKNFDRKYKDCVFAFAENLKITSSAEIFLDYHEVFIMKCLRETENVDITKEVCQTFFRRYPVELRTTAHYTLSRNELGAVTSVCKHMENLSIFTTNVAADTFSEILGFLREKCMNKLDMAANSSFGVCEISQVFSSLMALNCTCKHAHTELTLLKLRSFRMTETGLSIIRKFFEKGYASQLEHLSLNSIKICSNELCKVFNDGHCPNLTHLYLQDGSMTDEGAEVLFSGLTKALRKVISLDVVYNKLTHRCIPTLVKTLQDERCQLTDLSLTNNAIGDEGVGMLFEDALTNEHCKLTKLNLDKCSLTYQCIPSLCKTVQDERCQLTDLSLAQNDIGDEGVGMLFEDALINKHCKLTTLSVWNSSLTDQCVPSLCKALQDERCGLTMLKFHFNNFTENGEELLRDTMNYESCKARGLRIYVWPGLFKG